MIPIRDSVRPRHKPFINWLLIVINLWIFISNLGLSQSGLENLYLRYGVVPSEVFYLVKADASYFLILSPFITAMFLHGGWFHVIGNMWYLWIFGDNIEDRLGHLRYLLFYLATGIVGSVAHVLINPTSPVPIVGASGAIAGVLGGYFIVFPRARVLALVPIIFFFTLMEIPAVIFLALWFILQLFSGTLSLSGAADPIAFWAHIGGFLAGAIMIKLLPPRKFA